ncbi:MAG TPA: extracellular solute-binding protein [Caldilineaceae bacterium]|nr:extracellular solute-binding protein [Caldilineaceae bacterium]
MRESSQLSRRSFLRLSAGAAVTGVLAACTPGQPAQQGNAPAAGGESAPAAGTVTLRFVTNHGEADQPLFQKVLDEFAAREPDIVIEHLDIAGAEFYNAINTQGAAGQLPDVWYTRTFDVPVYASKGWTTNLQPYVDRDAEEVNVDDFWPAEVAQMQWQGNLYALPYDFSNVGIYYNKNMFDEAGVPYPTNNNWTWDDLLEVALPFVKQEGSEFTGWGLDMYLWNWVFHGILYGWGGQLWSEDFKTFLANSPENEACLQWFNNAREQGLYPEAGAAPQGVNPFAAGLVPMAFQGSWATVALRAEIGDRFDFDCVAMPKSPTGESCINAAGGAWGIASNTVDVEAAWTFNKFLTSTEATNILISEPLRSIPGRRSSVPLWNETASSGGLPPANVEIFAEQMEIAHAAPYPPYWQDYGRAWDNIIVPYLNGSVEDDAATTLQAFSDEVTRIIEQNMESLG